MLGVARVTTETPRPAKLQSNRHRRQQQRPNTQQAAWMTFLLHNHWTASDILNSRWQEVWDSAVVANKALVSDPTVRHPGFLITPPHMVIAEPLPYECRVVCSQSAVCRSGVLAPRTSANVVSGRR